MGNGAMREREGGEREEQQGGAMYAMWRCGTEMGRGQADLQKKKLLGDQSLMGAIISLRSALKGWY